MRIQPNIPHVILCLFRNIRVFRWPFIAKVVLSLTVLIIVAKLQWNAIVDAQIKKKLLEERFIQKCDPDDAICKHCPFFQERTHKMMTCVADRFAQTLAMDDIGTYDDAILDAPKLCTFEWLLEQRVVQLIELGKTMLSLAPSNLNAPMTALVIGHNDDFYAERQLALNITAVKYYGINLENEEAKEAFGTTLNGTLLNETISTAPDNVEADGMIADQLFQKYFPRRPVDVIFLNSIASESFISQLLGHGTHGIPIPPCQLNFRITIPKQLSDVKAFTRWLSEMAASLKPRYTQFVLGPTAISERNGVKTLQAYLVNVGNPTCVARFLQKSECRALIATEFDE
ncbi:unnamed protein product [Bursaphelenchus okinawaensis]|uniref:Uncharacterized protein n=1 Tax=Bursaphelenchus okinawaensis TaxID=465554 RepID=A0A811LE75_9BILA|nr:unnamed protein product [Bursaphelenchus okinawaensis]CAG9120763.1 unnamed protein product [Bursaphelenchus okinawaensis]